MHLTLILNSVFAVLLSSVGTPLQKTDTLAFTITVSAGALDREGTIVSALLPYSLEEGHYPMGGQDGRTLTAQVDSDGRVWFILDRLPAGSSRTYVLDARNRSEPSSLAVTTLHEDRQLHMLVGGKPVVSYFFREHDLPADLPEYYRRGGYLHPVYTPDGRLLTDRLPPDHIHHSGIWAAWTNTRFQGRTPDFWNVQNRTGKVDIEGLDELWEGAVFGGMTARHRYVDLSAGEPQTVVHEQWQIRVFDVPAGGRPLRIFDLELRQHLDGDDPLVLPEYHYGGVGFRGHRTWTGPEGAQFLTSEGHDRSTGHATRARWTHVGGVSDGHRVGIAILGHPSNYRHPQPVRIHPDEPFFNYAPMQLGEMRIEPGVPYEARYRYVTYDGDPDATDIERLWLDYAYPPGVTVSAAN